MIENNPIKVAADEIVDKTTAIKRRFNFRQLFIVLVLVFSIAMDVLLDYVNAGFNPSVFKEVSYWVTLAISCLSVVFVTLAVRDFFREKELRENGAVKSTQELLDIAHTRIMRDSLTTEFENFVNEINTERKRLAYRSYLQFKILHCKRDKRRAKWNKKLETADKDVESMPVRGNSIKIAPARYIHFSRVKIATVFARADSSTTDDDLETNESRHIAGVVFKKIFSIIAFSMAFSTLFFTQGEFTAAILVSTFMKLFRTAMSIWVGASDGQTFVRGTILSAMKRRLDFVYKFFEKKNLPTANV